MILPVLVCFFSKSLAKAKRIEENCRSYKTLLAIRPLKTLDSEKHVTKIVNAFKKIYINPILGKKTSTSFLFFRGDSRSK